MPFRPQWWHASYQKLSDYLSWYKDLIQKGIQVVVPEENDRELIAKRIYEELEFGIVKKSTLDEFNEIIRKMREEHGIEAVILGCTELPLILNDENCVLPCLDSVSIHIEKLIELAQAWTKNGNFKTTIKYEHGVEWERENNYFFRFEKEIN